MSARWLFLRAFAQAWDREDPRMQCIAAAGPAILASLPLLVAAPACRDTCGAETLARSLARECAREYSKDWR